MTVKELVKHGPLLSALVADYERHYPESRLAADKARQHQIDGGSHGVRLFQPYPFRINKAAGPSVHDLDGHEIVDFWQGHFANLLGHNPPAVTQALAEALGHGWGLQTGMTDETQVAFADLLCQLTGAERVRFTTSGTLATMYAIMLGRAFTGRTLVLKVRGGWHGANPMALKGVSYGKEGFSAVESAGLIPGEGEAIVLTRYNDLADLEGAFARWGSELACFILEPWMGRGGFMPASPEYLAAARELTQRHGAVLIFDEIISGFRFCLGGLQKLYGIQPDLSTFGKIIGGGMPVAAVAGRAEVMELCGHGSSKPVAFQGGTFSAHPLAVLAGKTMLEYLRQHEGEVYSRLATLGQKLRAEVERVFAERGILVRCTGHGNALVPGSSLGMVHFPFEEKHTLSAPDDVWDPARCDVEMREKLLKLGMLVHDVNVVHGMGAISVSHTERELNLVLEAYDAFAKRLQQ
jgi:glutamate-1-semialdehyde 2,1-aminomutase